MERYTKLALELRILSAQTIMNISVQNAVALDSQQSLLALC